MLVCLLLGAASAAPCGQAVNEAPALTAQSVLENVKARKYSGRRVDLIVSDVPLRSVFAALEKVDGVRFDLDPRIQKRVTYQIRQVPWDRVLAIVLADNALRIDIDLGGTGFKVHGGGTYVLAFDHPAKARLAVFLYRNAAYLIGAAIALPLALFAGVWLTRRSARRLSETKKALLPPERAEETRRRLVRLLEEDKVYLRPNLSLRDLAGELGVTPHQLSWLINDVMHVPFSSLVNGYRVDAAKQRLASPSVDSTPILDIGFEVGFGTKAAFNRAFRKHAGMTPSQFKGLSQQ